LGRLHAHFGRHLRNFNKLPIDDLARLVCEKRVPPHTGEVASVFQLGSGVECGSHDSTELGDVPGVDLSN